MTIDENQVKSTKPEAHRVTNGVEQMTTDTVRSVVERFLKSKTPEVLALKGAWGVGKTYTWNRLVQELKDQIALQSYSYVSLFGVSSISELCLAIFTKTRPVKQLGENLTAEAARADWKSRTLRAWRGLIDLARAARELPILKNVTIGLETLAPHLVEDTLVCLDDLERLSDRLPSDELLGFVSALKEEKRCKIVLIFNEEKLEGKEQSYKKYREKLVDLEVLYAPTPQQAAELVFQRGSPWCSEASGRSTALGIKNIRLLRKIDRLAAVIHGAIEGLHEKVRQQAVSTLVLVAWCYYETDVKKPTLEYLRAFNAFTKAFEREAARLGDGHAEPQHVEWEKALDDYGFSNMDEMDLAIVKVVEQGYIEETGVAEHARKLDEQIRALELEESFLEAWRLFNDTFANNKDQLVAALRDSFRQAVRHISPLNVNRTVSLLRELDENTLADEIINYYIEQRGDEPKLFDLHEYSYAGGITDPELRAKFEGKHQAANPPLSLKDTVLRLANGGSWLESEVQALDHASEDDFFNLFKDNHERQLHSIVKACLNAGNVLGHEEAARRIRAALDRIKAESRLNAIRVSRHLGGR